MLAVALPPCVGLISSRASWLDTEMPESRGGSCASPCVCVFSTDEPGLHHSARQADQSHGVEAFSCAAAEGRNSGRSSLLAVSVCHWLVMQ